MMFFISRMRIILNKYMIAKVSAALLMLYSVSIAMLPTLEGWTIWTTTWWFVVTVSTVGYGGMIPNSTNISMVIGLLTILAGVGSMAALLGAGTEYIFERRSRIMKGQGDFSHFKDHVVLMVGDFNDGIKHLIKEMRLDEKYKNIPIVLCSHSIDELDEPGVNFVKGALSEADTLRRAGIMTAAEAIVSAYDDNETVLTVLAIVHMDDEDPVHIVAYLRNPNNAEHIHRIRDNISIIKSTVPHRMVHEMGNRGIGSFLDHLISNSGYTFYTVDLPKSLTVEKAASLFGNDTVFMGGITFGGDHVYGLTEPKVLIEQAVVVAKSKPEIIEM